MKTKKVMFLCNDVAENIRALGALSTTLINAPPVRPEPGALQFHYIELRNKHNISLYCRDVLL